MELFLLTLEGGNIPEGTCKPYYDDVVQQTPHKTEAEAWAESRRLKKVLNLDDTYRWVVVVMEPLEEVN